MWNFRLLRIRISLIFQWPMICVRHSGFAAALTRKKGFLSPSITKVQMIVKESRTEKIKETIITRTIRRIFPHTQSIWMESALITPRRNIRFLTSEVWHIFRWRGILHMRNSILILSGRKRIIPSLLNKEGFQTSRILTVLKAIIWFFGIRSKFTSRILMKTAMSREERWLIPGGRNICLIRRQKQ